MKKKLRITMTVMLALAVGCGAGGYALYRSTDLADYSGRLNAELLRARALGMATTPSELREKYSIPEAENGGPLLLSAIDDMKKIPEAKVFLPRENYSGKLTFPPIAEMTAGLSAAAGPFKQIDEAVRMRGFDFHHRWESGPAVMTPEIPSMRAAGKALALRADTLSQRGDSAGALRSLESAFLLAKKAGVEPILMGKYTQTSIQTIGWRELQRVISRDPSPKVLDEASRLLAMMTPADLNSAIEGELVMGRVAIAMVAEEPGMFQAMTSGQDADIRYLALSKLPSIRNAYDARLVHELAGLYGEVTSEKSLKIQAQRANAFDTRLASSQDFTMKVLRILEPSYVNTVQSLQIQTVRRQLGQEAIRLIQHRKGDILSDPFGKGPYVYKPRGAGFVLYSVGLDGKDDGGIQDSKAGSVKDIIWEFRPSAAHRE